MQQAHTGVVGDVAIRSAMARLEEPCAVCRTCYRIGDAYDRTERVHRRTLTRRCG